MTWLVVYSLYSFLANVRNWFGSCHGQWAANPSSPVELVDYVSDLRGISYGEALANGANDCAHASWLQPASGKIWFGNDSHAENMQTEIQHGFKLPVFASKRAQRRKGKIWPVVFLHKKGGWENSCEKVSVLCLSCCHRIEFSSFVWCERFWRGLAPEDSICPFFSWTFFLNKMQSDHDPNDERLLSRCSCGTYGWKVSSTSCSSATASTVAVGICGTACCMVLTVHVFQGHHSVSQFTPSPHDQTRLCICIHVFGLTMAPGEPQTSWDFKA